jgi:hypothetical protein
MQPIVNLDPAKVGLKQPNNPVVEHKGTSAEPYGFAAQAIRWKTSCPRRTLAEIVCCLSAALIFKRKSVRIASVVASQEWSGKHATALCDFREKEDNAELIFRSMLQRRIS